MVIVMVWLPDAGAAAVSWTLTVIWNTPATVAVPLMLPAAPLNVRPTDSPEYLQEQREFEEMERNFVAPTEKVNKRYPNLSLQLFQNDSFIALATLK